MRRMIPQKQIESVEVLSKLTDGSVYNEIPSFPDVIHFNEVDWDNSEAEYHKDDISYVTLLMMCTELGEGWHGETPDELPWIKYVVALTTGLPESVHDNASLLAWFKQGSFSHYIDEDYDDEYFVINKIGFLVLDSIVFNNETIVVTAEVNEFRPFDANVLQINAPLKISDTINATTINAVSINDPHLSKPTFVQWTNTNPQSYDVGDYKVITSQKLYTGRLAGLKVYFDSGETEQFSVIDAMLTIENMVYDVTLDRIYQVYYYDRNADEARIGTLHVYGNMCKPNHDRTASFTATLYDKDGNKIPMTGAENTPKVKIEVYLF